MIWPSWWDDYKPFAARPFADRQVWVGYDPAETTDSAGLVVVAPPLVPGGKFRILERHQFRGMDFNAQAETIRKVTQRYWVTYIGIDTTGMGAAVAQLVRQFFPGLRTFSYSPEVKTRLVMKAVDVISKGRLEFDAGWTDVAQAQHAGAQLHTAPATKPAVVRADRHGLGVVRESVFRKARQHVGSGARSATLLSQVHAPRDRPRDLLPSAGLEGRAYLQDR